METDLKNFVRLEVLMTQACVTLRRIFRERWENMTGAGWVDSPASGKEFISKLGRDVYSKAGQLQRTSLEKGNIQYWDLSTLSQILLKIDFRKCEDADIKNKGKAVEKNYLQELQKFRNTLAHHPTKTIGSEEFGTMWKDVGAILVFFGYSEDKLEELRVADNIGGIELVTMKYVNAKNMEEANRLKLEGNKEFKDGNLDEAHRLYTEAIEVSDISDQVRAILHSNRASVYMKKSVEGKLSKNDGNILIENNNNNAIENAQTATSLLPTWWKAYYKLGQAYEATDKIQEALHAFERAVLLNPLDENVKMARDSCRLTVAKYRREDHLNPRSLSLSLEEQIQAENEAMGTNMSFRGVEKIMKELGRAGHPLADVYEGDRLRDGSDGKQSYEMAAKFYEKAANEGHAEGIYNLAMLTLDGKGVQKDIKKAITLFKQAAAQSPTKNGIQNLGVAEAEFAIGLLYYDGVGFDVNPSVASMWYERASDHGNSVAANNLGCMYMNGVGVEKNCKRAVQYWKLAASRNSVLAMEALCGYYLKEEIPEQAKMWYQRALENGSVRAKLDREKIYESLRAIETRAGTSEVVKWERSKGLVAGDLSLEDRMFRMLNDKDPDLKNVLERATKLRPSKSTILPAEGSHVPRKFDAKTLSSFAKKGSKTAEKLLRAITHFNVGLELLMTTGNCALATHHIAECLRINHKTVNFPMDLLEKFVDFVGEQLRKCPVNEKSSFDRDLHVCYACLRANDLTTTISFLGKAIAKYPDESCLYTLRANLYGFLGEYEEGLRKSKAALKLFPGNVELLCAKADFLKFIKNVDPKEIIAAHEDFLKVAEADDRKVPEAYYMISHHYFLLHQNKVNVSKAKTKGGENFTLMEKYYSLGKEAEASQLPCFLPYESDVKEQLELIIDMHRLSLKRKSSKKDDATGTAVQKVSSADYMSRKDLTTLTDPRRLLVITFHREMIDFGCGRNLRDGFASVRTSLTFKPKLEQKAPSELTGLKTITLRDMDITKDHVYEGYVLQVTSIEDAYPDIHSIGIVIEDENYDVLPCYVYNFPQDQDVDEKLGFGCKFSLANPYMRMAMDGKPAIRVDDPTSILMLSGRNVKMCRFCGKDGAVQRCPRCKRVFYCSKDCQSQDRKLLKHQLICHTKH